MIGSVCWASKLSMLGHILRAAILKDGIILPPGGNAPSGVIGQISGALELADQIQRLSMSLVPPCTPKSIYCSGEIDDLDAIVLAVGSSCTISGQSSREFLYLAIDWDTFWFCTIGLIIGIALAKERGLQAFMRPNFKIVGVPIHHAMAFAQRTCGNLWSLTHQYLEMLIKYQGLMTASWASSIPLTIIHTIKVTTHSKLPVTSLSYVLIPYTLNR